MINSNKKYGFTLMELMVAVIIIAILVAIAIPQYKHVVLKSRFSKVMPVAKSVADAQEVYYLGNGGYAPQTNQLDVEPITGGEITVALSETDGYDYVMAQHSKVPGARYIMYQKHSENYPSEIHCEAEDDNADAQWLCGVLSNNNSIGKTITDGYTTYIINGTGAGVVPGTFEQAEDNANPMSCDKAIEMGFTCTSDETTGVKKMCTNGICRTKTYNEDGSYTSVTCQVNSEGVCPYTGLSSTYDANGNKISERYCQTVTADGSACATYASYDNWDYTYDVNGNKISERYCQTVTADGSACAIYAGDFNYDYTYDANRNMLAKRKCQTLTSDKSACATYSSSGNYDYTYDANGNQISQRTCATLTSDGSACATYSSSDNYDYTYDANGNQISRRTCATLTSDGSACATYSSSGNFNYTYDANGNQTSRRTCATLTSDGSECATYKGSTYDYLYDDNGKQIGYQYCSGDNLNKSTGECIAYNSTTVQAN